MRTAQSSATCPLQPCQQTNPLTPDNIKTLPCGHEFHQLCMTKLFEQNNSAVTDISCPTCQQAASETSKKLADRVKPLTTATRQRERQDMSTIEAFYDEWRNRAAGMPQRRFGIHPYGSCVIL